MQKGAGLELIIRLRGGGGGGSQTILNVERGLNKLNVKIGASSKKLCLRTVICYVKVEKV